MDEQKMPATRQELIELIVQDFRRNGPIAHAVESYVMPRAQVPRHEHENPRSLPTP